MKKITTILVTLILGFTLTACGSNAEDTITTIKVGVVGEYNQQWDTINTLLEKDNIQVEVVKFSDYATPNRALDDGDIDANAFQHKAFLKNDIEKNNYQIESIGDTIIAPLAVFPNKDKITEINDLKDGDIVAIPSDATNGGRALKLLEEAGLIVCDPSKGYLPTVLDIQEYKVNIEILEAESASLANLLPDCAVAVINGGNAFTAGLNPKTDSIFIESFGDNDSYVNELHNVIVVRSDDANNEALQKVVAAYQSEEVEKTLQDAYQGAYIPAWK